MRDIPMHAYFGIDEQTVRDVIQAYPLGHPASTCLKRNGAGRKAIACSCQSRPLCHRLWLTLLQQARAPFVVRLQDAIIAP